MTDIVLQVTQPLVKLNVQSTAIGAAGGDLSGSFPNPTVAKVAGVTPGALGLLLLAASVTGALLGGTGLPVRRAATQDGVALLGRAGGTGSYLASITPAVLTANRTQTLLDFSGTVALYEYAGTFTAKQQFNIGGVIPPPFSNFTDSTLQLLSASTNTGISGVCASPSRFSMRGWTSGGSGASPAATSVGSVFTSLGAHGYESGWIGSANGLFSSFTDTLWTASSREVSWSAACTSAGSTGAAEVVRWQNGAQTLGGVTPTAGNGLLQLLSGTTKANGIAWGTDAFLYRNAANSLKTDGAFTVAGTTAGSLTANASIYCLGASATDTNFLLQVSGFGSLAMGANNSGSTNIQGATTGAIYLGTNASIELQLTTAGVRRIRIGSSGGFHLQGGTPVTPSAWSAWTGTATRTAIATSTATATQCAEAIKALVDDLKATGTLT